MNIDSFESPWPEAGADKSFSSTAVVRELVGPKPKANLFQTYRQKILELTESAI